jgi:type IV pilus assembly protein PilA
MSRPRLAGSKGFTLIELLVLVLIVGILAAVALATFLNQRGKAQDADAKAAVATAAKALEAWSTEHGGYDGATPAGLMAIERSLAQARGLSVRTDARTYTVSVDSAGGGGTFSMERRAGGDTLRDCTHPGIGGCGGQPDAQGDRW